jgi:hypothetical protein
VYIVWAAAWPTPRELPEHRIPPDAPPGADLQGVSVTLDDHPVAPMA